MLPPLRATRLLWALALPLVLLLGACGAEPSATDGAPEDAATAATIRLATTTSTRDSGLLDVLLPAIEADTGVTVELLAVGSGQALRAGADGDVDLLLTHAPDGERELLESGAASARLPLMYNDFVLVGPADDPAGIRGLDDVTAALTRIVESGTPFLSRGDDSGTHRKERKLWAEAGVEPGGAWYRETGQGMGATLAMAAESGAVTMVDRSTWSNHADQDQLPLLVEGDPRLRNPYAVLTLSAERHPHVQHAAAQRVADWLTGPTGRRAIAAFAPKGEQLFFLLDSTD